MRRRLASLTLAFVLGWAAGSTAAGWQQVAPLPEPRWMHVAACDLDGRVYAYAGYTASVPEARDYGLGQRALDIFDPKKNAWRRGPGIAKYRALERDLIQWRHAGDITSPPIREEVRWREYETGLRHEKPAGAGGRDGLIYWFGEAGPIHFDPKRGVWDRHALPVSDSETRAWLPPVPRMIRMSSLTATAPDGKIYLVGGIGHPLNRHERDPRSWHQWPLVNAVEVYDPATNTWEERRPMPRPRQEFAGAFGPDGKLYVFGGFGRRMVVHQEDHESEKAFETAGRQLEADARQALRSVEAYDPETDTWSERAPMPEGRHAMGAALGADGRIYVIGGAVSYSNPIASRSVFVYDPKTDRWEEGPRLGQARFHHAVAVDPSGRIYAVGGIENHRFFSRRGTASVEVLDTAEPTPKPAAALPDHE